VEVAEEQNEESRYAGVVRRDLKNAKPFKALHTSIKPEFSSADGGVLHKMDS